MNTLMGYLEDVMWAATLAMNVLPVLLGIAGLVLCLRAKPGPTRHED